MMDTVSPFLNFNRRANAMEHLMVHDIRDKVRRKKGMVEQTVNFDPLRLKAEKSKFSMSPRFAAVRCQTR